MHMMHVVYMPCFCNACVTSVRMYRKYGMFRLYGCTDVRICGCMEEFFVFLVRMYMYVM